MQHKGGRTGSIALPIWRDANRLFLDIETAVRAFSRYHKYTVGHELRSLAMRVCRYLARMLNDTGAFYTMTTAHYIVRHRQQRPRSILLSFRTHVRNLELEHMEISPFGRNDGFRKCSF